MFSSNTQTTLEQSPIQVLMLLDFSDHRRTGISKLIIRYTLAGLYFFRIQALYYCDSISDFANWLLMHRPSVSQSVYLQRRIVWLVADFSVAEFSRSLLQFSVKPRACKMLRIQTSSILVLCGCLGIVWLEIPKAVLAQQQCQEVMEITIL